MALAAGAGRKEVKPIVQTLLQPLLYPLSILYGGAVRRRANLFQNGAWTRLKLPGKIISIGNIEAGGTGKTPMAIAIAEYLMSQGQSPAILTRGYRSGLKETDWLVLKGESIILSSKLNPQFHADEARFQAARLKTVPVIVGALRHAAAKHYLEHFPAPTHWLLDDGFQHLKIERNLDLVLLDAKHPFGNGKLLPAGTLREPVAHLERADALILTRADENHPTPAIREQLKAFEKPFVLVPFQQEEPKQISGPSCDFKDCKKVLLVAAIARPERIRDALKAAEHKELFKGDHQRFSAQEVTAAAEACDAILTTEKDFWRDPHVFRTQKKPVFILGLKPVIGKLELEHLLAPVL